MRHQVRRKLDVDGMDEGGRGDRRHVRQEAMVFKPDLKSAFAINRKIVNTALGRDVVDALADYPIPVLRSAICQRVALAESAARGQTVFETVPNHPSGGELLTLVDEIMGLSA